MRTGKTRAIVARVPCFHKNPPMHIKSNPWKARIAWAILALIAVGWLATHYYLHPDELPEWAARTPVGRELQTTTVYKWQDAKGGWHITNKPPAAGTKYQVDHYSHDTNVLPPLVQERED